MEGGVEYAENALKPVINHRIDQLALRAQQIALDQLIDNKLMALRRAGEDLKMSVNDKVDSLMIQASDRRPDQDDPHYDEKIEIYKNWLEQVTEGIRNVHTFFDRIWIKVRELLDKVFKWIRDGVAHLAEKISKAFLIVKTTLFRCTTMIGENPDPLNSSIETSHVDPLVGVTNICLSSLENPSASKVRLRQLLRQVEKEFEAVLIENVALRKELERYGGNNNNNNTNTHGTTTSKLRASNIFPMIRNRVVLRTGNQSDDLVFSSTNQHRDVIWDVQAGGLDDRYFGSASADKTSIIWSRKTGRPLIQYQGHRGSVNSCRLGDFDHDLVLTASGDHEVHIWKWSLDENKDDEDEENDINTQIIRSPLLVLRGDDVLSCADWLQRDQIVSASWDRSATLWQVETGTSLRTLYGHDGELTYVSCHQTKPLVITSSRDGTFRLWDCRTPSHSVQIFNGHTKAVNSALFLGHDRLVSSSDDGFVHIWDSRSASCSPLISLECVSACNRISLSNDILAVPLDNRDIRLYSAINGEKLHVQRRAHTRAVQCTALVQCGNAMEFLLASGSLDRHMHVWHIKKLKGTNNNKLIKSLDESIGSSIGISSNEGNKNIAGGEKKTMKRTPLTEKPNNVVTSNDKKQNSNINSDKQVPRTMSTTTK